MNNTTHRVASIPRNLLKRQDIKRLIPVINVANATGWTNGEKPVTADGMEVTAFASGLDHPRWLYVLPNGDVLVAGTNAPANRPEDSKGIKGYFLNLFQKKAGAAVPSAHRITLLRDADGDRIAETKSVFLDGPNSPFGMVLVEDTFYGLLDLKRQQMPNHSTYRRIKAEVSDPEELEQVVSIMLAGTFWYSSMKKCCEAPWTKRRRGVSISCLPAS